MNILLISPSSGIRKGVICPQLYKKGGNIAQKSSKDCIGGFHSTLNPDELIRN